MGRKSFITETRFDSKKLDEMWTEWLANKGNVNEICVDLKISYAGLRTYRKGISEPPYSFVVRLSDVTKKPLEFWTKIK
jgi:hypothetical protein